MERCGETGRARRCLARMSASEVDEADWAWRRWRKVFVAMADGGASLVKAVVGWRPATAEWC